MAQQPGAAAPAVDHHREPCPDRILDDLGGAFSMGAVGGGLFHACKQLVWGPQHYKFRSAFEVCAGSCDACALTSGRASISQIQRAIQNNHTSTVRYAGAHSFTCVRAASDGVCLSCDMIAVPGPVVLSLNLLPYSA